MSLIFLEFRKLSQDHFHGKYIIPKLLQSNCINYSCFKLIVKVFTKIPKIL